MISLTCPDLLRSGALKCNCSKACYREEYSGDLSFSHISPSTADSYWNWNNGLFIRKWRQALDLRHRVEPQTMSVVIGRFHDLLSGLDNFYSILLNEFFAKESGVVKTMTTALYNLKDFERHDISSKLFGSWGRFAQVFTFHLKDKIDSAIHTVTAATVSAKDLVTILSRFKNTQLIPQVNVHLHVIDSSIRLAESAVEAAFNGLESNAENLLPDYIEEKRYKKLDRCLEKRREFLSLSELIVWGIDNITRTSALGYDECHKITVQSLLSLESLGISTNTKIGCQMEQALPHYLQTLRALQSCLSSYGSLIMDTETWLGQMESELTTDVSHESTLSIEETRYRLQRQATMNKTLSLMMTFSANETSIFDIWNGLCGDNMNEILTEAHDAYHDVSGQLVYPLQSQVREARTSLIQFYLEGLTHLSLLSYYFEDKEIKDLLESSARSLDLWRKPTFTGWSSKVSNSRVPHACT